MKISLTFPEVDCAAQASGFWSFQKCRRVCFLPRRRPSELNTLAARVLGAQRVGVGTSRPGWPGDPEPARLTRSGPAGLDLALALHLRSGWKQGERTGRSRTAPAVRQWRSSARAPGQSNLPSGSRKQAAQRGGASEPPAPAPGEPRPRGSIHKNSVSSPQAKTRGPRSRLGGRSARHLLRGLRRPAGAASFLSLPRSGARPGLPGEGSRGRSGRAVWAPPVEQDPSARDARPRGGGSR